MFLSPDEFNRLARLLKELTADDRTTLCQAVDRISPEELDEADEADEPDGDEAAEKETSKKGKEKEKRLTAKQFTQLVTKVLRSPIRKAFGESFVKDAADIAIFGRMVASDHSLTVEGAGLFSHCIVHARRTTTLISFRPWMTCSRQEEAGAGMTGTLEFTSATYYRYVALNLDLLVGQAGASRPSGIAFTLEERKEVVDTFLRAAILAVPSARQNSMNAHTSTLLRTRVGEGQRAAAATGECFRETGCLEKRDR